MASRTGRPVPSSGTTLTRPNRRSSAAAFKRGLPLEFEAHRRSRGGSVVHHAEAASGATEATTEATTEAASRGAAVRSRSRRGRSGGVSRRRRRRIVATLHAGSHGGEIRPRVPVGPTGLWIRHFSGGDTLDERQFGPRGVKRVGDRETPFRLIGEQPQNALQRLVDHGQRNTIGEFLVDGDGLPRLPSDLSDDVPQGQVVDIQRDDVLMGAPREAAGIRGDQREGEGPKQGAAVHNGTQNDSGGGKWLQPMPHCDPTSSRDLPQIRIAEPQHRPCISARRGYFSSQIFACATRGSVGAFLILGEHGIGA